MPTCHPGDAYRDPLKWLNRAVHGPSNLLSQQGGQFRAFGNSMLNAVLTTPAESSLYLNEDDLLVDGRSLDIDFQDNPNSISDGGEDAGMDQSAMVWACLTCETVLSTQTYCQSRNCVWEPFAMSAHSVTLQPPPLRVRLARCRNGHLWPHSRKTCPKCGEEREGERQSIDIVPASDIRFRELPR